MKLEYNIKKILKKCKRIRKLKKERSLLALLDERGRIKVKDFTIESDERSCALNYPKALKYIIKKKKYTKVIHIHNHPSNNSFPSRRDMSASTDQFNYFHHYNIKLIDIIIVAPDNYFSFAERNWEQCSKSIRTRLKKGLLP